MQMPYFRTPAHPLQQSPGLVVSLEPASLTQCSMTSTTSVQEVLRMDGRLMREHVPLASTTIPAVRSVMMEKGQD